MKYVFDFDRTLFDVARLYDSLERQNLRHLAGSLESLPYLDVESLLYADVRAYLASKDPSDCFILSSSSGLTGEWEAAYQRAKIDASGVTELVSEVLVMQGEKGPALAGIASRFPPTEPLVFVDDRIEQCLSVRASVPQAICCLMVRDQSVIGDTSAVQGIPVVHTLAAVDAIIEVS